MHAYIIYACVFRIFASIPNIHTVYDIFWTDNPYFKLCKRNLNKTDYIIKKYKNEL